MPCAVTKENMMYQNKLAVAIKHNGKILRENKDLVQLPFGSEFSVLIKNLNSRRVKFTLHIDGQDVLDGTEIIVDANGEVELKRFIRNGNMDEGNAFKFIERTQAIEDGPRGIKIEDGIVRVEYWFEQEAPTVVTTHHRDVWWNEHPYPGYRRAFWNSPFNSTLGSTQEVKSGRGMSAGSNLSQSISNVSASYSSNAAGEAVSKGIANPEVVFNDAGITVPGSQVQQQFHAVYGFKPEAQSHVIIIRLVGRTGTVNIAKPVTVKSKQKCDTCGHMNKANAKFCSECGTSLELV